MTIAEIKKTHEDKMAKTVASFVEDLRTIRAGRANPGMLESVTLEAYGEIMALNQLATVTLSDGKTLLVQAWDKGMVKDITKAINSANMGLNAFVDGTSVRVPVPPLSTERRTELVKLSAKYAESARVAVRNVRRDCLDKLKTLLSISKDELKQAQDDVQKIVDRYIGQIDQALKSKESDLMSL